MAKKKRKFLDWLATILVLIGGINWGLIGVPQLFGKNAIDLVQLILGSVPILANIVYTLVGVSALWILGKSLTGNFMR